MIFDKWKLNNRKCRLRVFYFYFAQYQLPLRAVTGRNLNKRKNMEQTINRAYDNSMDRLSSRTNNQIKSSDKQIRHFEKHQTWNCKKSSELIYPRAFLQTLV